ncbi:hypothetical protein HK096_011492, partial [Nowakowskiella sp. JEL0078]
MPIPLTTKTEREIQQMSKFFDDNLYALNTDNRIENINSISRENSYQYRSSPILQSFEISLAKAVHDVEQAMKQSEVRKLSKSSLKSYKPRRKLSSTLTNDNSIVTNSTLATNTTLVNSQSSNSSHGPELLKPIQTDETLLSRLLSSNQREAQPHTTTPRWPPRSSSHSTALQTRFSVTSSIDSIFLSSDQRSIASYPSVNEVEGQLENNKIHAFFNSMTVLPETTSLENMSSNKSIE